MPSNNEKSVNLVVNKNNFFNDLLMFIIIISLFFYFSNNSLNLDTEKDCKFRWSQSKYDTKFNFKHGCFININNVWVKENNIKFNISTQFKGK